VNDITFLQNLKEVSPVSMDSEDRNRHRTQSCCCTSV